MATYTNLTSLAGLKNGDVVTYTTTTSFDTKGYKFRVELYGKKAGSNGGLTKFIIDTVNLPETVLSFNSRGDLIYGNSSSFYYRIAVAGDSGTDGGKGIYSSGGKGAVGGGPIGGSASGSGGTQTSGYAFGSGQTGSGSVKGGNGGYGWYGGYAGASGYFDGGGGGGGGSGFLIGVSTSKYPSGYLGDDKTLQATIASAISEGELTQGGSSSYTAKMVLTVVSSSAGSNQSVLGYYNGTEFVNTTAKYFNGEQFIDCDVFHYNGNEFVKI